MKRPCLIKGGLVDATLFGSPQLSPCLGGLDDATLFGSPDEEVREIVENGHQQALAILNHNRQLLENIAQKILETEVIEGEELAQLLEQVISN